jgi:hypothetical protein
MQAKKDWEFALKAQALVDAEQQAAERIMHEKFSKLSSSEMEIEMIKRDKERHEKEMQAEAARREHMKKVQPTIAKLDATRKQMMANPDQFSEHDIFLVDRAISQTQAMNGDPDVAIQFVADVEAVIATRKKERAGKIDASIAELDSRRRELAAERESLAGTPAGSGATYSVAEAKLRLDAAVAEHGAYSTQALCANYALIKSREAEASTATEETVAT